MNNSKKKKITTVVLLLAFLAIAVTGGTLAYFTDTESYTHTYTTGNVEITLTDADTNVDKRLYPTMKLTKNPTIKNVGTENAYLAAKITVTSERGRDLHQILGVSDAYDNIDISKIVKGGLAGEAVTQNFSYHGLPMVYNNDKYAVYQVPDKANNTYVFYFFIEGGKTPNAVVTLFDYLEIPAKWDNAQMDQLKGLTITVDAFGVQEYGFTSCFDAMTTAFGGQNGEFNFN